jgi:putative transcriptional regulator
MAGLVGEAKARAAMIVEATEMKNRIRVLRAEKNWTQAELAKRLDVSRNTMNAIENNRYDPSLSLAFRIAKLFSLKMEDVFQDED